MVYFLQMPVVMIPIHFDRDPCERKQSTLRSFVLRPFITRDFMTGVAALPGRDIPEKVGDTIGGTIYLSALMILLYIF